MIKALVAIIFFPIILIVALGILVVALGIILPLALIATPFIMAGATLFGDVEEQSDGTKVYRVAGCEVKTR